MKFESDYGKVILRVSMSLVFLWFGASQIYSPYNWTSYIPGFLSNIFNPITLVLINGSLEIIFGLLMITGVYAGLSALILGVHLLLISLSLGYSALAVRDYGLAFATLSLFFLGPDRFCFGKE